MLKATQHFSDTGGARTQVTTFIPTWSFLLPFRAFFLGPGQTLLCPSNHQKVPLHLSQYLIFGGWGGFWGSGLLLYPCSAFLSVLPLPPHRFWFFKLLVFVGITVGAFYIPNGSFSNSKWSWWGRTGAARRGWGLLFALAHRRQAAGWVLSSHLGDHALVLRHVAFGQLGGGGTHLLLTHSPP